MSIRGPVDGRTGERRPIAFPVFVALFAVVGMLAGMLAMRSPRPPATTISGTVMSGGRPVVFGTVTAVAADARVYSAVIGPDGGYRLLNVPVGPVRIAVSSPDPRPNAVQAATRGQVAAGPPVRSSQSVNGRAGEAVAGPSPGRTMAAPGEAPPAGSTPPVERPGWFRIRGRYANPSTSGLGARVAPGSNSVDLRVD